MSGRRHFVDLGELPARRPPAFASPSDWAVMEELRGPSALSQTQTPPPATPAVAAHAPPVDPWHAPWAAASPAPSAVPAAASTPRDFEPFKFAKGSIFHDLNHLIDAAPTAAGSPAGPSATAALPRLSPSTPRMPQEPPAPHQQPPQQAATAGSDPRSGDSSIQAPKPSKNDIFGEVQAICKPAAKMSPLELAALRSGRTPVSTSPPPAAGESPGAETRSITVPMPIEPSPPPVPATPPAPLAHPPTQQQLGPLWWEAEAARIDAAFLRTVNTSTRRGFVDLDEIATSPTVSATAPTSAKALAAATPATDGPTLASTPSSAPAPIANLPALRAAARIDQAPDRPHQPSDHARPDGQSQRLPPPRVTHPGVWDSFNLSFLPTARNFLGEGRYAQVYRGLYTLTEPRFSASWADAPAETASAASASRSAAGGPAAKPTEFFPCAVKRVHPTAEAQAIALSEIFILRRLANCHHNIVRLIGVKDETDLAAPDVRSRLVQHLGTFSDVTAAASAASGTDARSSSPSRAIGLGVYHGCAPSPARQRDASPAGRAASTAGSVVSSASSSSSSSMANGFGTRGRSGGSSAHPPLPDPMPRLLIVLEFLPNGNLWDWTLRHRSHVGKRLWIKWAREIAGALEAIHALGIIHHDIKPHNILLSDLLDVRIADFGNACFVPEIGPRQLAAAQAAQAAVAAASKDLVDVTPGNHKQARADTHAIAAGPQQASRSVLTLPIPEAPEPADTDAAAASGGLDPSADSAAETPLQRDAPSVSISVPVVKTPSGSALAAAAMSSGLLRTRPLGGGGVGGRPGTLTVATTAGPTGGAGSLSASPKPGSAVTPGSPVSPQSQSLTNGLGRGTLAYSAPDLLASNEVAYSFPVDMYSLGVTLYALISGHEPFGLARSSVHMMVGIQRGFFASGMQVMGSASVAAGGGGIVGDPRDGVWRFLSGEPVPDELVQLVMRLVERDPADRPTAEQVVQILERVDAAF
ncbi:hypothetical protein HK105_204985 [Polyrhizophydium stewartii]|uniref:non-specific serine/threonine protein kinase n=1 Tax=Polyrhizophydium stewartii TaxID=2732419 RepID=A0ABR4N791_9FUNG